MDKEIKEILKTTEKYLNEIITNQVMVCSVNIGFREPLEGYFLPMSDKWEQKPQEGEVVIRFYTQKENNDTK